MVTISRIMRRALLLGLMLLSITSIANAAVSYDAASRRLSVDVRQMPLQEFLQQVSAQTGLRVDATLAEPHPVTLRMQQAPLEVVLKSALRSTNYALKYDTGRDGKPVLREVRVMAKGEAAPSRQQPAPPPPATPESQALTPEQQRQQKIARILEAHRQRDGLPATQRLNVVNRPPTPSRSAAAADDTRPVKRERSSTTTVGRSGKSTTAESAAPR